MLVDWFIVVMQVLLFVFALLCVLAGIFGWSNILDVKNRGVTGKFLFTNAKHVITRIFYVLLGSFFCVGILNEFLFITWPWWQVLLLYVVGIIILAALIFYSDANKPNYE